MIDRTAEAVRRTLTAVQAPAYEIGIFDRGGMYRFTLRADEVLARLPYLKARNARGAHIYFSPSETVRYTLLDDLTAEAVGKLTEDGFAPCALVETSPGYFQAWLKHATEMQQDLASLAAKVLTRRYGADASAAGWRRFGRLPGFTNQKEKYRRVSGRYPFVLLHTAPGHEFPQAAMFGRELTKLVYVQTSSREDLMSDHPHSLSPQRGGRSSRLSLAKFRQLGEYTDCPAAADVAFSVAALAAGMSEKAITLALQTDYLSSDPSRVRRDQYVVRTLRKAISRVGIASHARES